MLHKVVDSLPAELERDSLYFVQTNNGFDLYVTNHYGSVVQAYPLNPPGVIPVTRTISSNSYETLFSIDLNEQKTFEWSIEVTYNEKIYTSKIMAVYTDGILDDTEFAMLGYMFNIDIKVTKKNNDCKLTIYNNESFDISALIRLL